MKLLKTLLVGAFAVLIGTMAIFADGAVREAFSFKAWLVLLLAAFTAGLVMLWPLHSRMERAESEGHWQIGLSGCVVLLLAMGLVMHGMALSVLSSENITCSMHHGVSFEEWWQQHAWKYAGISIEEFRAFPFPDGLTQRDASFGNASADEVHVGDVLVFRTYAVPEMIAHRVVAKWGTQRNYTFEKYGWGPGRAYNFSENHTYFSTYGDAEFVQMPYERKIGEEQVMGVMVARAKDILDYLLRSPCG